MCKWVSEVWSLGVRRDADGVEGSVPAGSRRSQEGNGPETELNAEGQPMVLRQLWLYNLSIYFLD